MKATFSPPEPSSGLVLLELTEEEARGFIATHNSNGASSAPLKKAMALRLQVRKAFVEALPGTGCKCGKEGECCAKS